MANKKYERWVGESYEAKYVHFGVFPLRIASELTRDELVLYSVISAYASREIEGCSLYDLEWLANRVGMPIERAEKALKKLERLEFIADWSFTAIVDNRKIKVTRLHPFTQHSPVSSYDDDVLDDLREKQLSHKNNL